MIFKRKEGFRFVFNEPIEAKFVLHHKDGQAVDQPSRPCKILDISPRGIKIFTNAEIGQYNNESVQIEVDFILDDTNIRAIGEIVWSRPFGNGKQLGIQIVDQLDIKDFIISEMKQRRNDEVLTN